MAVTERATETQSAYLLVRRAILAGELLPGQRLVEKELSERFGVGRAAIRTALARLEQEGLVESEPFRGARVRTIGEAEAVEILEARAALEALAAHHAAQKATPEQVEALWAIHRQMEERHRGGDLLGMSELNSLLHRTLVEISGHQTAARLIEGLRAQGVRHQFHTILVPGRPQQSLEEHRRIIAAVAAHQPEEAEAAMKAHLGGVIAALKRIGRSTL
ncbi:HTH-type transcriptional repressor RspR [Meiothermus luteus]|jgi:DNA-binding GntR family transcriptional regulator|uniref:HTH-type transcriptional repressor RspR n=1 Tax=Meiothermus luteus TaxID=2026184 RepID=A0A399ECS1_9DEIN|nr:GntR family transcriptional regulator [Meiothermus luteus]RIH82467.1 HTH-type transcriptional repressor RspR [Meiothermus luteus]RMH56054.1 MAG: FCD domain-containing protein [Deinococcota bacterium]